jgi:hypothetical protein
LIRPSHSLWLDYRNSILCGAQIAKLLILHILWLKYTYSRNGDTARKHIILKTVILALRPTFCICTADSWSSPGFLQVTTVWRLTMKHLRRMNCVPVRRK